MGIDYIVTGACGHLGSAVVKQLAAGGEHRIRALVLPGDTNASLLPEGVEPCFGDVLDNESLIEFFNGADKSTIVIHCAGIVNISSRRSEKMRMVNVEGTKNITDMCIEKGVKKLVYVSSVHAIPEAPKGNIMTEETVFDPSLVVGPYAKTKAEATAYVMEKARAGLLNASVVFPSGIFGPYDKEGRNHLTQLVIDFCQGRMPMGVRGGYDFVDVRDVASGVLAVAEHGRRGEGYLLSNRKITISEMFELLHKESGAKRTKVYAPMWLAKASVPFCTLYYKLKKKRPLFSAYSLHTLSANADYSHNKASAELGYTPRPFRDTVRDTITWLKSEGRIAAGRYVSRRRTKKKGAAIHRKKRRIV